MATAKNDAKVDKNDDNKADGQSNPKEYVRTSLIDVVRKLSPYCPNNRISKWNTKLAAEDLDYLIDLLVIPQTAICLSRFSSRLYGELLRIRKLPIIQMNVIAVENDNTGHEFKTRLQFEGSYIDIGDKINNERVFVQVSGDGGIKDVNQRIIYQGRDKKWKFYFVLNSQKGHYMMSSKESIKTHFEILTWEYYNGNQKKNFPITLHIKTWNV